MTAPARGFRVHTRSQRHLLKKDRCFRAAARPGDFSSGFSFLHTMVRAAASRTPHEADVITWPGAFMVCVATIATIPASTMRREAIRPAIIDDERVVDTP